MLDNEPLVQNSVETYYTGVVGSIAIPETHLFYYKDNEFAPPCWTGNSSRHGQKGTTAFFKDEENMLCDDFGNRPDVILTSTGFPKRMTIGLIAEMLLGLVAAEIMETISFDNFNTESIETIVGLLAKFGIIHQGSKYMYDGTTGKKMLTQTFMCPIFYQRLKHMVADKLHARGEGPNQQLTRQPTKGRISNGGGKISTLMFNTYQANNAFALISSLYTDNSDGDIFYVCNTCGFIAYKLKKESSYVCTNCGQNAKIFKTYMPYINVLLQSYFAGMKYGLRFKSIKN